MEPLASLTTGTFVTFKFIVFKAGKMEVNGGMKRHTRTGQSFRRPFVFALINHHFEERRWEFFSPSICFVKLFPDRRCPYNFLALVVVVNMQVCGRKNPIVPTFSIYHDI